MVIVSECSSSLHELIAGAVVVVVMMVVVVVMDVVVVSAQTRSDELARGAISTWKCGNRLLSLPLQVWKGARKLLTHKSFYGTGYMLGTASQGDLATSVANHRIRQAYSIS